MKFVPFWYSLPVPSKTPVKKFVREKFNSLVQPSLSNNAFPVKFFVIALVILGLIALGLWKKNLFVAATVNGQPITSIELLDRLNQEQRTQVLDNMVNERIILQEAKKNNSLPTQQEIDVRIADLEKKFGGVDALNNLLTSQGETKKTLQGQIKIQLAAEKLYVSEATVSTQEVEDFIRQYKTSLQATDPAGQKEEATQALKQQKLSQIFNEKFQELKKNANIKIF